MACKDGNLNNLFWKFSLKFYAQPKVASNLISLQDDLGVDVNLILCCFWSADRSFPVLSQHIINDLSAIVEDWNVSVIKPLRSVRLGIKYLESNKYIKREVKKQTGLSLKQLLKLTLTQQRFFSQLCLVKAYSLKQSKAS